MSLTIVFPNYNNEFQYWWQEIVYQIKIQGKVKIKIHINYDLWTTSEYLKVSSSWRGVLDTTLSGKVCQWLVTGR
jgi:hypothetical protein